MPYIDKNNLLQGDSAILDSPIVELSFLLRRDSLQELINLADRNQCSVAQIVRAIIDKQLSQIHLDADSSKE